MQSGDIIGTYQIAEKIGEGAMGQVFRGKDIHLDRDLAIKVLLPEISSRADLVSRFRNEALTMAKLHHSNICSVYAFLEHQGEHLMVLQFVEGQTVEKMVKEHGKLLADDAMRIIAEILSGLTEAHQHGIVHRDLKPSNLMMTKSGKVVIMDFGIAKTANQVRQTRVGMMVGTLEYASPEQLRGEDVGAQSDLYSLAIAAVELLTGKLPFKAETDYEWIQAHTTIKLNTAPIQRVLNNGELAGSLSAFIEKATNKEPGKRFASALEMLQELNRIRHSTPQPKGDALWTRLITQCKANPVAAVAGTMTVTGLSIFFYAALGTKHSHQNVDANSSPSLSVQQQQPTSNVPLPTRQTPSAPAPPADSSLYVVVPAENQAFVVANPMPRERVVNTSINQPPAAQGSAQPSENTAPRTAPARPRQSAAATDNHLEREKARLRLELGLDNPEN